MIKSFGIERAEHSGNVLLKQIWLILHDRFNQTLERAITEIVNEEHDDWDQHSDGILFSYRTAQHDSRKVLFGRQPRLPIDMDLNAAANVSTIDNTATASTIRELTQDVVDRQRLAHNDIQTNIKKDRETTKGIS